MIRWRVERAHVKATLYSLLTFSGRACGTLCFFLSSMPYLVLNSETIRIFGSGSRQVRQRSANTRGAKMLAGGRAEFADRLPFNGGLYPPPLFLLPRIRVKMYWFLPIYVAKTFVESEEKSIGNTYK
ncbi:unnamed protein product [Ectocarpus sp. 12 AP-2014]